MIIALDATPLCSNGTGGVGRYVSELVPALAREFPADRYVLLADHPFPLPAVLPNLTAGPLPSTFLERRWWTLGLRQELKRQAASVFHGVNFAVPFPASIPAIITIHDLSPWRDDPWTDGAWRMRSSRVRNRLPWLLRTGAVQHIITPSEAVRSEVIGFFDFAPERVTAIPLAAGPQFRMVAPNPPTANPYFLFVGMLEPRKNVAALIDAWSEVRKSVCIDLVIAGPRRPEVEPLPPQPGLILLGEVPEEDLPALYSGASAFVYPSHYEGFGLPVLEAMQCGAPVIVSADPALRETVGDAGLSTSSTQDLANAMHQVLTNLSLWQARSLARAALFSWERTARATRAVYQGVYQGSLSGCFPEIC